MNKKRLLIMPILFFSFFLFSKNIMASSCANGGLTFLFENGNLKIADVNSVLKMCGASKDENCYVFESSQSSIEKAIQNQNCGQIIVKKEKVNTSIGEKTKYVLSISKNSTSNEGMVSCGSLEKIPARIPQITSTIITAIQIIVPVLIVIFGMFDFLKAVVAQKDDEIKKGQKMFLKRLLVGILVFFVIVIVKFVINIIAGADASGITDCMDCFLSNNC